jgi:tetratricopeptide (TPR) repeat protein
MKTFARFLSFFATIILSYPEGVCAQSARSRAPSIDVNQTVNVSYQFKKNEEPEMSSDEYALYEKVVGMVSLNRDFALKILEPLVAAKAESTPAFLFVLGNVYFTEGQHDVAEDYYRRAIEQLPTFTRAWANLGNLLFTQGNYAEAAVCFTKVTATAERDASTLSLLAYCLDRLGRRIGAEMNYVQALGIDPDHVDSLRGLMSLSLDNGQLARAEELLKQLIRLRPDDRQNWSIYGSLLASQNRHADAIGLLESAAALDLLESQALSILCDLYIAENFQPELSRAFERLHAKDPALAATRRLQYVRSLVAGEDHETAERELAAVALTLPAAQRADLLWVEAELRVSQERWPEARVAYENWLLLEPLRGEALIGLGGVLKALGEFAAAELVFDRAAQLPPFAYRGNLELADSALRHKRYSRALNFLERAAAMQRTASLESYIAKVRLIESKHENIQ